MLGNDQLRERLRALVRSRRSAACESDLEPGGPRDPATATEVVAPTSAVGVGVEEFLPGGTWSGTHGTVYVHERLRSTFERRGPDWGWLGEPPVGDPELSSLAVTGLHRTLFLDLETGGLTSSPLFLAGTMHWNGSDFVLRQYFARHYGEEAALVEAISEQARGFAMLVTFNGKSYDVPFLMGRAVLHGVTVNLPAAHLDVLHAARRRWKGQVQDCRLQTLERSVCRRRRYGDVPSDEVPALYHDFVRNGDPYRLVPVFHHNLLDVITMSEILTALFRGRPLDSWHSRWATLWS